MPFLQQAFATWWNVVWSIATFLPAWWRDMQGIQDYAHQVVND